MFIKVPRNVYNFFAEVNKTRQNLGKIVSFANMEIAVPLPFHNAETLIKHSPNAKWVARSGSKGTKRSPETLIKHCQNATVFVAWATLHKPL